MTTKENYYVQSGNQNLKISSDSQESAIDDFFSQCAILPTWNEAQLGEVIFVSKNPIEPDSSKDAKMYHTEEMATQLGYSIQKGEDDEGPRLTVFNG